jgi:hypothetical protein
VTCDWWWIDEDKQPCLKRDSSQRPSDQGLRLRPRGHWGRLLLLRSGYFSIDSNCLMGNEKYSLLTYDPARKEGGNMTLDKLCEETELSVSKSKLMKGTYVYAI